MVVKEEYKSSSNQDAKRQVRDKLLSDIADSRIDEKVLDIIENTSAAYISYECPLYDGDWCKEDFTEDDRNKYEILMEKIASLIADYMLEVLFYYDD